MNGRGLYNWISAGIHLTLALCVSGIGFSSTVDTATDLDLVYRVNIVTRNPAAGRHKAPAALAKAVAEKTVDPAQKFLPDVVKEQASVKHKPTLKPPEPPKQAPEEKPQEAQPADQAAQNGLENATPGSESQGKPGGVGGESSDITLLWKQQVRAMVENLWKAPQGGVTPGAAIEATYALHVSGNGELLNMSLVSSSGNSLFDRSIELALSSIGRLPPPPSALMTGRMSVELTLSFSPPKGEGQSLGGI